MHLISNIDSPLVGNNISNANPVLLITPLLLILTSHVPNVNKDFKIVAGIKLISNGTSKQYLKNMHLIEYMI